MVHRVRREHDFHSARRPDTRYPMRREQIRRPETTHGGQRATIDSARPIFDFCPSPNSCGVQIRSPKPAGCYCEYETSNCDEVFACSRGKTDTGTPTVCAAPEACLARTRSRQSRRSRFPDRAAVPSNAQHLPCPTAQDLENLKRMALAAPPQDGQQEDHGCRPTGLEFVATRTLR